MEDVTLKLEDNRWGQFIGEELSHLEMSIISIFGTLITMLVLSIWDEVVTEWAEPILPSSCNASINIVVNSMVHPFKGTWAMASLTDTSSFARFPRNRFTGLLKVVRGIFFDHIVL
ncbi:MAG: hypothetical protein WCF90_10715 [Methanomicrobiales archaeon]